MVKNKLNKNITRRYNKIFYKLSEIVLNKYG